MEWIGEDGHGNTARKSHHDGVRNILDDGAQLQKTEQQQEHASHDGGYHQSLYAKFIAIMYEREGEVHMADGSGGIYALAPIK